MRFLYLSVALLCMNLSACGGLAKGDTSQSVQMYVPEIIHTYPHDRRAFTQGLLFADGKLYESTGRYGQSTIRIVDLDTGAVQAKRALPSRYFGEGMTLLEGRLYSLTWQSGTGFIFDAGTLKPLGKFTYSGEGWGLTTDGKALILSDGTSKIRFIDPDTFTGLRTINVTRGGLPVDRLNELEWIDGSVYANIWQTHEIVRIDPKSGHVTGVIDAHSLIAPEELSDRRDDVLNGIAWDKDRQRLFLTGKNWPKLFEVALIETPPTLPQD